MPVGNLKLQYASKGLIVKKKYDSRIIVKDTVEQLRFSTSYEKGSIGVSYISAPVLNVDENILIKDTSYFLNGNTLEEQTDFLKLTDNFEVAHANFWITDIFTEINGEEIPLYLRHDLSAIENFSHLEILDSNYNPIDPELWFFIDESIAQGTSYKSIYTNLESSIDKKNSTYELYYVRYKDLTTNSVVTEILDTKPFYQRSSFFTERTQRQYVLTQEDSTFNVQVVFDSLNNSPTPYVGGQRYSVKIFKESVISVQKPAASLPSERWYLRISPGDIKHSGKRYWTPEYYTQLYNPVYPYRSIKEKEGIFVERDLLYTDIFPIANLGISGFFVEIILKNKEGEIIRAITNDPNADTYITKSGFVTSVFYEKDVIESISSNSGFIKLKQKIPSDLRAFLSYRYEEKYLTYNKISVNPSINPEILGKRIVIYCKPEESEQAIHHLVVKENGLIEKSSETHRFETVEGTAISGNIDSLIDDNLSSDQDFYSGYELEILSGDNSGRKVKILGYDKTLQKIFFEDTLPQPIIEGVIYRINKYLTSYETTDNVLQKTYSYVGWEEEAYLNMDLKLADIYVIQTIVINDIKDFDARVLGGGVKEERVKDALSLQDEVRWYWDIGSFDGDPYPGMGSVLIELPRYILKELDGPFTREQVEEIVIKHMGDGSYPLIKYYDASTEITSIDTGDGFVEVKWRLINANKYNIYIGNTADNLSLVKEEPGTRNSTRIENLENNKQYYIQIEPVVGGVERLRSRALSFIPFSFAELDPPILYDRGLYSGGTYE